MKPRWVAPVVALGIVLLASGVCLVFDTWVAFSVVVVGISLAVVVLGAEPLCRLYRALDDLYRAADAAVWRGEDGVDVEEVAAAVERSMGSDGEVRRADWARYRAWRQGESTEDGL